jgi:hypothetical protein
MVKKSGRILAFAAMDSRITAAASQIATVCRKFGKLEQLALDYLFSQC